MLSINAAAAALPWSGIREVMALAAKIPNIIRLDIGDPSSRTPDHVTDAAHAAAMAGRTHYTPSAGLAELRSALTEKVSKHNRYHVSATQVIITQGASQGIFAALLALTQPGDGVLLPDPAWPNYRTMSQLLRIDQQHYRMTAGTNFLPSVTELAKVMTPRTRALLINSPGNPTGAIVDTARMHEIVDFARRNDLWIISDECYDELGFDDTFVSPATIDTGRVISAYSFSKTYAMTGWRIGYLTVPETIANTIGKCQESLVACVSEPTQWAALTALRGPQDQVTAMRDMYHARGIAAVDMLRGSGMTAAEPCGTFYVWLDVSALGASDNDIAMRLLKEYHVSVAPGSAFGDAGAGFVRLSLTASDAEVTEGVRRIAAFAAANS